MHRPSEIRSRLTMKNGEPTVLIGGRAAMSLSCDLRI